MHAEPLDVIAVHRGEMCVQPVTESFAWNMDLRVIGIRHMDHVGVIAVDMNTDRVRAFPSSWKI